jgi:hypothetical protein
MAIVMICAAIGVPSFRWLIIKRKDLGTCCHKVKFSLLL